MLTVGSDFHPRYQQIAMLDAGTGEILTRRLEHKDGGARGIRSVIRSAFLIPDHQTTSGIARYLVFMVYVEFARVLVRLHLPGLHEGGRLRSEDLY